MAKTESANVIGREAGKRKKKLRDERFMDEERYEERGKKGRRAD